MVIKYSLNDKGTAYAKECVDEIARLWDEKKIKDAGDIPAEFLDKNGQLKVGISLEHVKAGFVEVSDNKKHFRVVKVFLKSGDSLEFPLTAEEFKWYRYFRRMRLGY